MVAVDLESGLHPGLCVVVLAIAAAGEMMPVSRWKVCGNQGKRNEIANSILESRNPVKFTRTPSAERFDGFDRASIQIRADQFFCKKAAKPRAFFGVGEGANLSDC